MTATHTGHWATDIDVAELHEPTVRAIIDTMKRTGAPFAAHVLECQYKHDQIGEEPNALATRLRQLADFVDANPDIKPNHYSINGAEKATRIIFPCDNAEQLAEYRRRIGGLWAKSVDSSYFNLDGMIGNNYVQLYIAREEVCERVVVGTEIELVRDPDAPMVEQEVEIVEWVCPESILLGVESE